MLAAVADADHRLRHQPADLAVAFARGFAGVAAFAARVVVVTAGAADLSFAAAVRGLACVVTRGFAVGFADLRPAGFVE